MSLTPTTVPIQSNRLAFVLLILTALFWSGNFVLARAAHASIPPITLAFWRWTLAGLILIPLAGPKLWRSRDVFLTHWRLLIPIALLGITGYNTLVYIGLQHTLAINGGFINAFIPVLILLFGALFFSQPLSKFAALGIGVSLGGVLVLVAQGHAAHLRSLTFNPGDLWVFAAAICWALYTHLIRRVPPIDRLALLLGLILLGWLALLPLYAWETQHVAPLLLSTQNMAVLAYVGVFPSVLAYLFYNFGIRQIGAAAAGQFIHLMPVFIALMSITFLHETAHAYHFIGITLILSGLAIARIRRSPP